MAKSVQILDQCYKRELISQEEFDLIYFGHKKWIESEGREGAKMIINKKNMRSIDLNNKILDHADLSDVDLAGARLLSASINNVILKNSCLPGVNFSGAEIHNCDLSNCNLSRSDFLGSDISNSNFNNSTLLNCRFREAIIDDSNFSNSILSESQFVQAIINDSSFSNANLVRVNFREAKLKGGYFEDAKFTFSEFKGTIFNNMKINGIDLSHSRFENSKILQSDLSDSNLSQCVFIKTLIKNSNISNCLIYGVSTWEMEIVDSIQNELIITEGSLSRISVDDIEVAQFVYLLLNNNKIRNVIDAVTQKGVLILGRFTPERKIVLDSIREKLREYNFLPMMFDFDPSVNRDFTETIKLLVGLSRFVIVDISNPKSSPLELQATIPDFMVPFIPIIQKDEKPFSMFIDLIKKYDKWVLQPLEYNTIDNLMKKFEEAIIKRALDCEKRISYDKAKYTIDTIKLDDV